MGWKVRLCDGGGAGERAAGEVNLHGQSLKRSKVQKM